MCNHIRDVNIYGATYDNAVIGIGMILKLGGGGLSHCEHVLPTVMPVLFFTLHQSFKDCVHR